MFKSTSTSLILLGILAVIVGIIAVAWAQRHDPHPGHRDGRHGPGQRRGRDRCRVRQRGDHRARELFIIFALVSVALGILLFARPSVGAVTLALLFGLYSLIYGFSQIIAGTQLTSCSDRGARPGVSGLAAAGGRAG